MARDLRKAPDVCRTSLVSRTSATRHVARSTHADPHRGFQLAKRALDIAVAAAVLLVAAPVIAAAAVAIAAESGFPVLYRSRRVGRYGREFSMLKLRKMHVGVGGPPLTVADDERLTRVGRIISRLKIDELPQLWNVIRGDMSLVGPRPQSPEFVASHHGAYEEILRVRPGITGLSQVAFAREDRVLCDAEPLVQYLERILPQKLQMDRMYVRTCSLGIDLRILFWTFVTVCLRIPVAVDRTSGRMRVRWRLRQRVALDKSLVRRIADGPSPALEAESAYERAA